MANKINYLGDLLFSNPEKISTLMPTYKLRTNLFYREEETKFFTKKYYPEINFTIYNNPINKQSDDVTLYYTDFMYNGILATMISSAFSDDFETYNNK